MKKDKKDYRILVVEDNPGDYVIVEDFLMEFILTPFIIKARSFKEAADILSAADQRFDVILLDLNLPDKSGQHLVTEILEIALTSPVIVFTGYTDIDFSIRSIGQGISDYLLKDELNAPMLYKSIIYAIERKETFLQLKRSEKRYSDLFDLSPQPMWVFDSETFRFTQVNKATIALYGYTEEEFMNMTLMDIRPKENTPEATAELVKIDLAGEVYKGKIRHLKKSGQIIEVEIYSTPITIHNKNFRSVIAIDVTEKNQYENKITRAIIKTQEDERYEIGGELHDNVCQILAASQLNLGMLKRSLPESGTFFFDQCRENIGQALTEIRNLSHRLAPAFFDESTLEEAFMTLFNTFIIKETMKIELHFDDSMKKYPLSMELQLNIYRVLQEQLRNILKHANATLIEVDVIIHNNKLKMRISDNGVGFNVIKINGGIGLANMKRRAELFSGKLEIDSFPGKGCTILLDIPLPKIIVAKKKNNRDTLAVN